MLRNQSRYDNAVGKDAFLGRKRNQLKIVKNELTSVSYL